MRVFKNILFILLVLVMMFALAGTESINGWDEEEATGVAVVAVGVGVTVNDDITTNVAVTAEKNDVENAEKSTVKEEEPLRIVAVGDILLGRGVKAKLEQTANDYTYPFQKVAGLLKQGDVIFGNLEAPLTDSPQSLLGIRQGGKYVLRNEVEACKGIVFAGFNLLSIANNHILDCYEKGLFDTIDILNKQGIAYSGAGKNIYEARKPAVVEKKGAKIGMLSYTDMAGIVYKGNPPISFAAGENKAGVASRIYDYIKADIDKVRGDVDILIVSMHWGKEESFDVLPEQVEMSHMLIDSGVDMVLGHHPHQFQGIEIYNGKPIVYSLGNFIFDQNDTENQETFIISMEYFKNKLHSLTAFPVRTVGKMQIVPLTGDDATALLEREADLSQKFNSECEIKEGKIIFAIP